MSSTPPGYHGAYLRIDLSEGVAEPVPLSAETLRRRLGGSGLGTEILLREEAAEADPLSADAALAFVFSPLVGSPLTTSAKFAVVSKSPLTERINDSLASSGFALAGKKTGYDALVLTGTAAASSVVVIDDGQVRIEPAGELTGAAVGAAEGLLADRYGPGFQFAVIGPAGERQVRYATISHDGRHAGRGGSGAVLGAKRVKAIAVRGTQRCCWADPTGLVAAARQLSDKSFGPATAKYRELGTAANLLAFNRLNVLPTRNFQLGSFAEAESIAPEQLRAARESARASCAACTIGCEHLYALQGKSQGKVRLEYESLFALGSLCGVSDSEAVLACVERCDQLGLDTISAGGTIAFAMECVERGYLAAPELRFGNGDAVLAMLEAIGSGTGLGPRLALGSRALAAQLGGDSLDFAPQVKGLEMPGYDPRGLQTMGLGLAVATRGADHNRSGAYEADFSNQVDRRNVGLDAARLAVAAEDRAALMDSLILCKFLRGVFDDLYAESAAMLRLVTGWDVDGDELRETARQIVDLKKRFNIRAGWTPAEDTLPPRMLNEALPDDPQAALSAEKLQQLIGAYNLERGWTRDGWLKD